MLYVLRAYRFLSSHDQDGTSVGVIPTQYVVHSRDEWQAVAAE